MKICAFTGVTLIFGVEYGACACSGLSRAMRTFDDSDNRALVNLTNV